MVEIAGLNEVWFISTTLLNIRHLRHLKVDGYFPAKLCKIFSSFAFQQQTNINLKPCLVFHGEEYLFKMLEGKKNFFSRGKYIFQ